MKRRYFALVIFLIIVLLLTTVYASLSTLVPSENNTDIPSDIPPEILEMIGTENLEEALALANKSIYGLLPNITNDQIPAEMMQAFDEMPPELQDKIKNENIEETKEDVLEIPKEVVKSENVVQPPVVVPQTPVVVPKTKDNELPNTKIENSNVKLSQTSIPNNILIDSEPECKVCEECESIELPSQKPDYFGYMFLGFFVVVFGLVSGVMGYGKIDSKRKAREKESMIKESHKNLHPYVSNNLRVGYTMDQIKQTLVMQGWEHEILNEVFQRISYDLINKKNGRL